MREKAISVLGMHRSGTSMLMRLINQMGVCLGNSGRILPAAEDNSEGFWEQQDIVCLHDELFGAFDLSWDSTQPLPEMWLDFPKTQKHISKLYNVLHTEFSASEVWGWKDPRTSILLPLWEEYFREKDLDVKFIIAIRNPISVARSLQKRDGFTMQKALYLWYYYTVNTLKNSQKYPRLIVDYDRCIQNSQETIDAIANFLGIHESMKKLNSIKKENRHNNITDEELSKFQDNESVKLYIKMVQYHNCILGADLFQNEITNYTFYSKVFNASKDYGFGRSKIYLDYGEGYSEKNTITGDLISSGAGKFKLDYKFANMQRNIKKLRWDPLKGSFCRFKELDIKTDGNFEGTSSENGMIDRDGGTVFLTTDPIFLIHGDFGSSSYISIEGTIEEVSKVEIVEILFGALEKKETTYNKMRDKKDKYIGNLETVVADKDKYIGCLEDGLVEKDKQIQMVQVEKKTLALQLGQIYNSRGWKLLCQLRRIKSKINKVFHLSN